MHFQSSSISSVVGGKSAGSKGKESKENMMKIDYWQDSAILGWVLAKAQLNNFANIVVDTADHKKKTKMVYIINSVILTFGLLLAFTVPAQQLNLWEKIELDSTLSTHLLTLEQSSDGFYWLGSTSGLFRYDGNIIEQVQFKQLPHSPVQSNPTVLSITEGKDNELWIGTTSGLYYYDKSQHRGRQINSVITAPLKRVYYHNDNVYFISYDSGLVKIHRSISQPMNDTVLEDSTLKTLLFKPITQGYWVDMVLDSHNLWALNRDNVLWRINLANNAQRESVKLTPPKGHTFKKMLNDSTGRLWFTTIQGAVVNLNKSRFSVDTVLKTILESPGSTLVAYEQETAVAIATNDTLYRFNKANPSHYQSSPLTQPDNTRINLIGRYLFSDKQDRLWLLGNQQNQLFRSIDTIAKLTQQPQDITFEAPIEALFGNETGLYVLTKHQLQFKPNTNPKSQWKRVLDVPALTLIHSDHQQVWLQGSDNTIYQHHSQTNTVTIYAAPSCLSLINAPVYVDQSLSQEAQLVFDRNLGMIEMSKNSCQRLKDISDFPVRSVDDRAIFTVNAMGNHHWLLTSRWGYGIFDRKTLTTKLWQQQKLDPKPVFVADKLDQEIYFALNGTVLYRFNTASGTLSDAILNVLPKEFILQIVKLAPQKQLVVTSKGGFIVSPEKLQYINLYGLSPQRYQFFTHNNQLLFSKNSTLYQFAVADLEHLVSKLPKPYINDYQINHQHANELNQPQYSRMPINVNVAKNFILDHTVTHLGFKLSTVKETKQLANIQYRLVGLDDTWITLADDGWLHLLSPPAGQYELQTRAQSVINGNTSLGQSLPITVKVHPMKRTEAIMIYALSLIAMIVIAVKLRLNSLQKHKLRLETQVYNRTQALHQTVAALEEKTNQHLASVEETKQLLRLKDIMLTAISHELKTPLTTINTPLKLLSEKLLPTLTDEDSKTMLMMIKRSSNRIENFIEQLLVLAKLDKLKQLETKPLALDHLTLQICRIHEDLASQYDTSIKSQVQSGVYIQGHQQAIEILLGNLLSNAIKHRAKAASSKQFIEVSVTSQADDAVIEVRDHSIKAHKIDTNNNSEGLGLLIVREIVQAHKGFLSMHFNPSYGLLVSVKLKTTTQQTPVNELTFKTNLISEHTPQELSGESAKQGKRILIVEDEPEVAKLLGLVLKEYQLIFAQDAETALNKLNEQEVDLVLTDHHLPQSTGIDLTHSIKSDAATSHIPVLVISANAIDEVKTTALQQLADVFVSKPFNHEYLKAQVQSLLQNRAMMRVSQLIDHNTVIANSEDELTTEAQFINKLHQLLEQHYKDPEFKLSDHIAEFGMSERNLRYKISALSNESPTTYLYQFRIEKAKLLVESDLSFETIASRTGFKNVRQFRERFEQYLGIKPSQMRQALKHKKD